MTQLSLCIPTYNRSEDLAVLLDSILAQNDPDIEVVISDNASTDDTPELVERYRACFSNLVYIRQPQNIGMDRNFLAVVDGASGDYVWLLSDDDSLEKNAVSIAKINLNSWRNIPGILVNTTNYDCELKKIISVRMSDLDSKVIEDISAAARILIREIGFLTANIVRRDLWMKYREESQTNEFLNYYVHVYIINKILYEVRRWGYIGTPLIKYRSDNERLFNSENWHERLRIDYIGYNQIIDTIYAENAEIKRDLKYIVLKGPVMSWVKIARFREKIKINKKETFFALYKYFKGTLYFWTKASILIFFPTKLLSRFVKS